MDVKDYWKNDKKGSIEYREWYQNECLKSESNQGAAATDLPAGGPVAGILVSALILGALAVLIALL